MTRRVAVLRIGHRQLRDARVTTHVALAARAFGAERLYLHRKDPGVVESIQKVVSRWGGNFCVIDGIEWKRLISQWRAEGGAVVHLTMYGERLIDVIGRVREHDRILVVLGAEKVPGELYGLADYNVSVTSQPHSEISSLAVFLDHLFQGEEFGIEYPEAEMRITGLVGSGEDDKG
ncbi:MAG: tRNA (cytidine(56)-2'-O)-methyltransferase [Methanomicrobiales archaeon]|nr:tRNA (cytidine(56)-2'-O)-methyltransferase [Methanomicrobiales archaeon]